MQGQLQLPASAGTDLYIPNAQLDRLDKAHHDPIAYMQQHGLEDPARLQWSMRDATICLARYCNESTLEQSATPAMLMHVQLLVRQYGASPTWIIPRSKKVGLVVGQLHSLVCTVMQASCVLPCLKSYSSPGSGCHTWMSYLTLRPAGGRLCWHQRPQHCSSARHGVAGEGAAGV
jgi:hypothetical protein